MSKAPKLFLGDTELIMGDHVKTDNLRELGGMRAKGILGMDCLKHYCIQFDFKTDKIRFLDPDKLNTEDLGNAYPLTTSFGEVSAHADFFWEEKCQHQTGHRGFFRRRFRIRII